MSYYSDFDKQLIKKIAECDAKQMIVFGDLISKELFKIGKLCLVLMEDETYQLYAKNIQDAKKLFGDIVDVLSLIKRLEESNLVYAFEMDIKGTCYLFYEGRNKIEMQGDRLCISNKRYIDYSGGKIGQLYKNDELELSAFMIDSDPEPRKRLYKELKHVFNSLIYKTPELEEFVKNDYKTQDEIHHEQVMKNANQQICYARWTFIASVITLLASIFLRN